MKDYSRVLTKITSTPWMITPDALTVMLEIFDAHLTGQITHEEIRMRLEAAGSRQNGSTVARSGKIGVLPIHGPIFPKANMMTEMSGATSLEQLQSDFRTLMADPSVTSILLDVDSPGGMSDLVDEMAQEIRTARESKPIYSIANTSANSAAYALAAQATKMYSTPSGQVGSVGTYMVHTDQSRRKEAAGITETVIKAGRFKAVPLEPLSNEGREYLQNFVNDVNDQFIHNVAEGRAVSTDFVRANFGDGGIVSPRRAVESKMIDGVATFDEVVKMISTPDSGASLSMAGLAMDSTASPGLRQSYDADKEHSEPGTGLGGEPTPREPPEKGDKAIEGGWRRDPPPIAYETEESAVNRAWLEDRATALSIAFDENTSDEDLATSIASKMDEIVVPLNVATTEAAAQLEFEQQYPEQAQQLASLLQNSRAVEARQFADGYARFEGTSKGFSTLMRDKIEEAHTKVATRNFSQDDLKELLDLAANKEATVEYAEQGSSRNEEGSATAPSGNFADDRRQFAELVKTAMTEDKLSRQAAIEHVSQAHPALAQAYLSGHAKA